MYFPFERMPSPQATVFVRTSGDPLRLVPEVRQALRAIEPASVVDRIRTMTDIAHESVQVTKLALWLLGLFAAAALVLAAVGVYGVMSYAVRQRTKEIGTRMAFGATRGSIIWLVMRNGLLVTAAGAVIGLAAGLLAARSLAPILYRVSPSDPTTALTAMVTLVLTAMAACYLPARRAASLDPAQTLSDQ